MVGVGDNTNLQESELGKWVPWSPETTNQRTRPRQVESKRDGLGDG